MAHVSNNNNTPTSPRDDWLSKAIRGANTCILGEIEQGTDHTSNEVRNNVSAKEPDQQQQQEEEYIPRFKTQESYVSCGHHFPLPVNNKNI